MNREQRRAATRSAKRASGPVDIDGLLAEAIRRHRGGDLARAERLYSDVLKRLPESADALHFLGVLRHQQRRSDDAVSLVRRALAIAPQHVDAWNNLGNIHKEMERLDDAETAYRRALELDSTYAAAWNNLGVVLRARGQPHDAVAAFRRAIALAPPFADPYFNLGNALRVCGTPAQAAEAYREALVFDPTHALAHRRLGILLYALGAHDEAAAMFRQWLERHPGDPVSRHMLAACSGMEVPPRASDAYIVKTFDGFAASFDEVLLERLDYHAPELVAAALARVLGDPTSRCDVLDAGCGTGLCGPLVRPYAKSLSGVDLSPGMLAKARTRGVYDTLHEDEITRFLGARSGAFDTIVSADTLCYFGALGDVARAAYQALRRGGWLVYTVERADDADDYRINPHGRYSHAPNYVRAVMEGAGFTHVDVEPAVLRLELRTPVQGFVVTARVPVLQP